MSVRIAPPDVNFPACFRISAAVERLCGVVAAAILVQSSFAHLANPYAFLDTVFSYRLVPEWAGPWVAAVVPFLQLVLAVCLVARWWPRTAYAGAVLLFLTFAAVQAVTLARGLDISCGCFGSLGGSTISWRTLALAGSCALACALGLILCPRENSRCATAPPSP